MALYPLFFLIFVASSWITALAQGPIWALLAYIFVYFNIPSHQWWGDQLPSWRWSLISAGILVTTCIIHRKKLSDYKISNHWSGILLLLILVTVIVTSIFSPYPEVARGAIYDFFRYVLIYYLVNKVVTKFDHYRYVMMVMLGTLFYFAHVARSTHMGGRLERFGLVDANDSNMLAALVLLLAPFYVAFMFSEKGWKRIIPVVPFVYIVNMFMLCQSRGAFVGLLFQVILAFFLIRKKIGLQKSIILCVALILSFYILLDKNFKNRIYDTFNIVKSGQVKDVSSGRTAIWGYSKKMIIDYPFGSGAKTYENLSMDYIPDKLLVGENYGRAAHNTYLRTLIELNVIGLILFLLLIFSNIVFLAKSLSENYDLNEIYYIHRIAILISICGFFTASFFIDRLFFEAIYIVMGLIPFLAHNQNVKLNIFALPRDS